MTQQRWWQSGMGRSRLFYLAALGAVILLLGNFVNLEVTRRTMQARHDQAQGKVDHLVSQNDRLQRELERAQQHQFDVPRAFEYFGLAPTGWSVMETEDLPVLEAHAPAPYRPSGPPFWAEWIHRLRYP